MAKPARSNTKKAQNSKTLGSVERALELLLLFRTRDTIRLSDVPGQLQDDADEPRIGLSTAHRLLATLQKLGFVWRDEKTRAYVVGPALSDLARAIDTEAWFEQKLYQHLLPFMEKLSAECEETVHLLVVHGTSAKWLGAAEYKKKLVRTSSRAGDVAPAYPAAAGRALLAELEDEQIDKLFTATELEELAKVTSPPIDTLEKLKVELRKVKRQKYATNFGEMDPSIGAIGVVVRDARGKACAGIAVSAPIERLTGEDQEQVDKIARAANKIAKQARAGL
jgi:DNA-binding IclR family transcriptional regulator